MVTVPAVVVFESCVVTPAPFTTTGAPEVATVVPAAGGLATQVVVGTPLVHVVIGPGTPVSLVIVLLVLTLVTAGPTVAVVGGAATPLVVTTVVVVVVVLLLTELTEPRMVSV
jgi:hypothetical protein